MTDKYGYIGIMKPPIQDRANSASTIYCVTDSKCGELIIIPLVPGFFDDAYKVAKNAKYQRVIICVPSADVLFISDLFNLIMALNGVKPIYWVYPDKLSISTSVEFELAQLTSMTYKNNFDSAISIEYIQSNVNDSSRKYYDIIIRNGTITVYLCQYATETKLTEIYSIDSVNEIHVPYSSSLYGGLTFPEISKLTSKNYYSKLRLHSFTSLDQLSYCVSETPDLIGRCAYNEFI